ncbi:MAG: hypothetical protein KY475_02085 [Planctomycetes bacterium]|nr:hypothetical protein [Planctomycetota bacterium]
MRLGSHAREPAQPRQVPAQSRSGPQRAGSDPVGGASPAEAVRLIAQFGGYINRKRNDEPGPQTVWLGLQRVHDIARCWLQFGPGE